MFVKTENPKDIKSYPIVVRNHNYLDTAIAFSELLSKLPEITGGNRDANNFIVIKTAPLYCNNVEYNLNTEIAYALKKLLESINSDLDKANQDGFNDGTNVLVRLANGTISMDDFNAMIK